MFYFTCKQDACPAFEGFWSGDSPPHLHLRVDFLQIIAEEMIIRCMITSFCRIPWAPWATLRTNRSVLGTTALLSYPSVYLALLVYSCVHVHTRSNAFPCDYREVDDYPGCDNALRAITVHMKSSNWRFLLASPPLSLTAECFRLYHVAWPSSRTQLDVSELGIPERMFISGTIRMIISARW